MKTVFCIVALILAQWIIPEDAFAGTVGLHLVSVHSTPGYNSLNLGAYYRADNGATLGAYCNSESRSELFPDAKLCQVSRYVGYTVTHDTRFGDVSATIGIIQGYQRGTMPMILPTVRYDSWRVAIIPRIDPKRGAWVVHLMREF